MTRVSILVITAAGVLVASLVLALPARAVAQVAIGPVVPMWQPQGTVNAMVIDGHTLYAGGQFDQVAPRTGRLAVVDSGDATAFTTGAGVEDRVDHVVADGAGGWFIAGIVVGGVSSVSPLLHILPNGERDTAWTPPVLDNRIGLVTIAVAAGRLFIAGAFESVNGVPRPGLAALDPTTGAVLPWTVAMESNDPRFPPSVFALAAEGKRLFVAGSFAAIGGSARGGFAVLDASTGALLDGTFPTTFSLRPFVQSIAVTATHVYVYGQCRTGTPELCAFDLEMHPIAGWTFPSIGGFVATTSALYSTVVDDGSRQRSRIRKLDPDTGSTLPWSTPEFSPAGYNTLAVTMAADGVGAPLGK